MGVENKIEKPWKGERKVNVEGGTAREYSAH